MIDATTATRYAGIALGHVGREYPHKPDHVMGADSDALTPRVLHPIFFGSFDWHSCVHSWWLLLFLARLHPSLPTSGETIARADALFTPANITAELAYLERPLSAGFERPYGWAWLLALHAETAQHSGPLADRLAPLAHAFAGRFHAYLPRLTYPIRAGTHANTAFACLLALDWAHAHDLPLMHLIETMARNWFEHDADAQAWEPDGDAFLSPTLTQALLMASTLGREFTPWMAAFLPRLADGEPASLFSPAIVSDRGDGKIAHLDGLNLSRAWCWNRLAPLLAGPAAARARAAADTHLDASLPYLDADYMGAHWLASFAALALISQDPA